VEGKDYFDAKFEGLEKLVAEQGKNLTGYVGGVNSNVKELRAELQAHKESSDAHGLGASNRQGGSIALWLSLAISVVAAVAAFVPLLRH
jgi:hypothetical protein